MCTVQRIPYLGPIYGGLREGVSIYIQGSIPEDITRFFLNLLCGESESSDIALHFNPRFDGWDKVVFNSCEGGSWGSEDKIRDMPFSKGEAFEMVIMATSQEYQIKVNGNDFYTFQHRLPLERVCAMQIDGDVCIQTINVIGVRLPTPEALVSMLWALGFALCSGANMFIQHHEF
ncbi:Galectin-4 [Liparis tanakae]|uniref:Galectin n=1 Tax=Liparis tanakae TaxID=230148 RepID=A0A4Z2HM38_9TELE|nr:Galectin-4 [Liparis tanakae]